MPGPDTDPGRVLRHNLARCNCGDGAGPSTPAGIVAGGVPLMHIGMAIADIS
jgi:hypothetical protein